MAKPNILIVEDEKDVARIMAINLKLEGMDVNEVYDGEAALHSIHAAKPDCVVLDIMLPKMSGWDVLKHIKDDPFSSDIPVVMVTAKVGEHDKLRGLGAGAVKYITKPFSPVVLTETIKSVLRPQTAQEVSRERRETIERLQLSTLHNVSDILISAPSLDELLKGIAHLLIRFFELPGCAFILSGKEPEVLTFLAVGKKSGNLRTISRSHFPKETDDKIQEAFSRKRHPVSLGSIDGFKPMEILPGLENSRNVYILPLLHQENYHGAVVVPGRPDTPFSRDEENLLSTITNQVAVAVERARLYENIRQEEVVHRRLLHQTINAQESERRRVAAEIHDGVLQSLVGISYRLQAVGKLIPPDINGELRTNLNLLENQLNNNIGELRELLLGLRPPMLDDMGLFAALATHLKDFRAKSGINANLQLPDALPALSKEAQINLFRITQEALNNVDKHANASHVTIKIEAAPERLHLTVRDDGKGFPTRQMQTKERNLGVASMRERTELLGGHLDIKSEKGKGTVISLDVPMRAIMEG